MNTWLGRRYISKNDGGEHALENLAITEDHAAKVSQSFRYDFDDHLSRVP